MEKLDKDFLEKLSDKIVEIFGDKIKDEISQGGSGKVAAYAVSQYVPIYAELADFYRANGIEYIIGGEITMGNNAIILKSSSGQELNSDSFCPELQRMVFSKIKHMLNPDVEDRLFRAYPELKQV